MGIKDSVKLKILQELMQNTNKERPTSIWKLRAAVYRNCEKEWNTLKNNSDKSLKKNMCKCQYKNDQKVENKNVHFPRSIPQLVFP